MRGARRSPGIGFKLRQMHLNGGTWNGRKILSPEWSKRAASHLIDFDDRKYGYLWYAEDYAYKGRTVRGFFAGGNGGQLVIGIPELDLVIAFYGGSYADPAMFVVGRDYVPQYILSAIDN